MHSFSRREFMRITGAALGGTILSSCVQPVAPTEPSSPGLPAEPSPTVIPEPTSRFLEAPMLADLVVSGDLPPVAERLPANPHVCPVIEMTGKYGGTIRRSFKGVSDRWGPTKIVETSFLWYNPDLSLRACLAESWELNADATEWTFHLREGTKWSDATDFTSEDVAWYWEHHLQNEEITQSVPSSWSAGTPRVLADLSTPDAQTVVLTFVAPNPFFAYNVTRGAPFAPGHYLEQFHADFVSADDLAAAVSAAGVDTWVQLYQDRMTWYLNPEYPSLGPWLAKNTLNEELFLMERNPYFYQVDAEGQQLPYVDRIQHRLHSTADVFAMWVINGEIDFFGRHLGMGNYTLFKENEENGDYRVMLAVDSMHHLLHLNQTTQDARAREMFNDRNVRIALSHAIDRDEINDLVFDGIAEGRQYSPVKGSPQYYPKQAFAHVEYDPDLANSLLDEAGYSERGADGHRLWKDGSGDTLTLELVTRYHTGDPVEDAVQMVIRYLDSVGLKIAHRAIERALFEERSAANDAVAHIGPAIRTFLPMNPGTEFDGRFHTRSWGCAWSLYRQDPDNPNAEAPPDGHWLWNIWALFDSIWKEADEAKRQEMFLQVLDIWAEELPTIGIIGQFPAQVIVKNGLHNYLEGYPMDGPLGDDQLLCCQTLFWDEPEKHA